MTQRSVLWGKQVFCRREQKNFQFHLKNLFLSQFLDISSDQVWGHAHRSSVTWKHAHYVNISLPHLVIQLIPLLVVLLPDLLLLLCYCCELLTFGDSDYRGQAHFTISGYIKRKFAQEQMKSRMKSSLCRTSRIKAEPASALGTWHVIMTWKLWALLFVFSPSLLLHTSQKIHGYSSFG